MISTMRRLRQARLFPTLASARTMCSIHSMLSTDCGLTRNCRRNSKSRKSRKPDLRLRLLRLIKISLRGKKRAQSSFHELSR